MKNKVLERHTIDRKTFLEILASAFAIGISASLYGSMLFDLLDESSLILHLVTAVMLTVSLIVLSRNFSASKEASVTVDGFIILDKTNNTLVEVPKYDFSESIYRYMNAAFIEKHALKQQWDSEPLTDLYSKGRISTQLSSLALVKEAAEYYIVESLSTHLTDYFNSENFDQNELIKLTRDDVPSILLQNRFMALFSESMKDRSAFSDMHNHFDGAENIVMSGGKGGTYFSRFDLVIPKGATVSRQGEKIVIDTPKFVLTLSIRFDGTNSVTPRQFEKWYLGYDNGRDLSAYHVRFDATVKFNFLGSLHHSKWNYYEWLDSYFESVESEMSSDAFLRKIGWETAATIMHCKEISAK